MDEIFMDKKTSFHDFFLYFDQSIRKDLSDAVFDHLVPHFLRSHTIFEKDGSKPPDKNPLHNLHMFNCKPSTFHFVVVALNLTAWIAKNGVISPTDLRYQILLAFIKLRIRTFKKNDLDPTLEKTPDPNSTQKKISDLDPYLENKSDLDSTLEKTPEPD